MKVINIHERKIAKPKNEVAPLLKTLASDNDLILATNKWPPMRFDKGLQVGSKGGHGPIKYHVTNYRIDNSVTFQFDLTGFDGFHKFEFIELQESETLLKHTISMTTSGWATLKWALAIRWLHDAFIEDAFDKVENYVTNQNKSSQWSLWVRILRRVMKPKRKKN
ncbi:hypothetical protein [Flavobacterium sp. H122]|uniref:hypothetical protein n=1 Tax=Flavobacterium sp. H122 TaxID=2529860 RepID=UPI0010AA80EA|nr:hypothetical protein [Flavobacterium sp. H122]